MGEIYTDDKGLAERAKLCGINPISLNDCPLPDHTRQGSLLDLEQHDELPEAEDDDDR